jgi:hypothetical protein
MLRRSRMPSTIQNRLVRRGASMSGGFCGDGPDGGAAGFAAGGAGGGFCPIK